MEKMCPECKAPFTCPTPRPQGGGRHGDYCSSDCHKKAWSRRKVLRKRSWTEKEFQKQLQRQGYACLLCLMPFEARAPSIDHSHTTGKVRGLLCNQCNTALGMAKESPETLRRMIAYLEYDLTAFRIYLAGTLANPRIPLLGNRLRAEGFDVMDEWWTPGPQADEHWQEYEGIRGRTYKDALQGRAATNIYLFDRAYLDLADAIVVVLPAGKSAMIEMGYAVGRGKQVCFFLDEEPKRYDIMPRFADMAIKSEDELVSVLRSFADAE